MNATKDCFSNRCVKCASYLIYEILKGTILIIENIKRTPFIMEKHEFPRYSTKKYSLGKNKQETVCDTHGFVPAFYFTNCVSFGNAYASIFTLIISSEKRNIFTLHLKIVGRLFIILYFFKKINIQILKAINSFIIPSEAIQ